MKIYLSKEQLPNSTDVDSYNRVLASCGKMMAGVQYQLNTL
jgi:hypothetical protein